MAPFEGCFRNSGRHLGRIARFYPRARPSRIPECCHRIIRGDGTWGHYAFGAEMKTARKLVQEGLAHAAASDIHRPTDAKEIAAGMTWIRKQIGQRGLDRMLAENTRHLLAGEMPDPPTN